MGAKASKPAQTASRRFPQRTSGAALPPQARTEASAGRGRPKATQDKAALGADGRDPDMDLNAIADPAYSDRLRQMGVATPFPTFSNSSTVGPFSSSSSPSASTYTQTSSSLSSPRPAPSRTAPPKPSTTTTAFYPPPPSSQNRTLNALEARRALQVRAEAEFDDGVRDREFLDASTVRRALVLLNRGSTAHDIESKLHLKPGVVARLGPPGVVIPVEWQGMRQQTYGGYNV